MTYLRQFLAVAAILLSLLTGCERERVSEKFPVGSKTILFDGSSGTVKVFLEDSAGNRVELMNTRASHRKGWKVERIDPDLMKLYTGDCGWFKVFQEGTGWMVLPEGVFLSPSKQKAVHLRVDGGKVKASLGDTEPPFTDLWINAEAEIDYSTIEKLNVKWLADNRVEIVSDSTEVLATLEDNTSDTR